VAGSQTCYGGQCVGSSVGAACSSDIGCLDMLSCRADGGYAGGYCTLDCTQTGACPAGALCMPFVDAGFECRSTCSGTCRSGYRCTDAGVCEP
jgi:hypothetical protein